MCARRSDEPVDGCDLPPIDLSHFEGVRRGCIRCEKPDEIRPAIRAALTWPRPMLFEALVDSNEKPAQPDELKV
jgi:thiamine pyrophosphate-dependent acetolactate synthase large subunit-like protein